MFRTNKAFIFLLVALLAACTPKEQTAQKQEFSRDEFPNVLEIHNIPKEAVDWSSFCFSDQGAWFGFALPDTNKPAFNGAFIGPFMMTNGKWLGKSIARLAVYDNNSIKLQPTSCKSVYYPGKLVQDLSYEGFDASMSLIYISSNKALIDVKFKGSVDNLILTPEWSGSIFSGENKMSSEEGKIVIRNADNLPEIKLQFNNIGHTNFEISDTNYRIASSKINLSAEKEQSLSMLISYNIANNELMQNDTLIPDALIHTNTYFDQNKKRWDTYLNKALQTNAPWKEKKEYQTIAVKSVVTLLSNWRCAYGDLLHDGLFPSYAVSYFNGFWAWDSWKHSVALAKFAPDLAKDQIRAMYDYQNSSGMVADCIYSDSTGNNWLNTKPPLSGWAIWEVFEETKDTTFLVEMYPKLLKYHQWWYNYRDLNKNFLCEYGSSDGSLVAAKWESGMDNAIRFDKSKIVKIDDTNFAFNQESVDLNSYLYFEKLFIVKIATILNDTKTAAEYNKKASILKELVEIKMYDKDSGFYYDINLKTGNIIPVQGPEGWIPLFTKLSSENKAQNTVLVMLDTTKFNTYIPFPTAPKDDPEFSDGYWRGPIWLDQVYFAIEGLRNYGQNEQANILTYKVFDRLEGLKGTAPIRENYCPLTGEGMRVNHFSWSAAHLLLLYNQ